MARSKLEKYLSILEVLVSKSQKFESISIQAGLECGRLRQCLNYLISHGLVEERDSGKKEFVYAITERGLAVFKTLHAQRYLRKLRNVLPIVKEASEVGSVLSKQTNELKKKS